MVIATFGSSFNALARRAGGRGPQPWRDSEWCPAHRAAAMSWSIRDKLGRYGFAVLSVLIALLLSLTAEPLVEVDVPFALFLAGIVATAWYGGLYPGVVASILATSILFAAGLDASIRMLPAPQRWVRAVAFGCEGALVSLLVVLVQRFWARARRHSEEELRRREDELLSMLSHELHSPLAPIVNSLQILRLADLRDPTLTAARDVLDRQVRHLAGLVDGLIDLFGIVDHQVSLNRERIDLAELARRIVDDVRPAVTANGIALELQCPNAPVWVDADLPRMQQVLANLMGNAAKFSSAGDSIRMTVTVDAARQRALVTVRDTGVGLAPQVMGGLFQAFAQGSQPMARRLGGMGLGLALVKGVVELHGGEVHAASAGPGRGSEFGFWIPLAPVPTEPAPPTNHNPTHNSLDGNGHQLRLLIVEDNEDTAETLRLLMKRFGYDVQVA